MKESKVFVLKGENPYQTTRTALQKFPLPNLKGKKVLLKPNAARIASPGDGITTHPLVVLATIDHLKEKEVDGIVIGESCIFGVNAQEAFRVTGMKEISDKGGVELIDLDQAEPTEITIPKGKVIRKIKVPNILKKFDFVISIPVMKTHMHAVVTLSLKNMKGVLWRREKARLHHLRCNEKITKGEKELDVAISEMASVLFPDLSIIDGTVGMEGMGPAYGKAKKAAMIVIGNNALSADAVAAQLMGIAPESVPHLRLSAERGLGSIQAQHISIEPQDYLKWKTLFNPPPAQLSISFPGIVVHDKGSCSACLSTLMLFLQNYHLQLTDYRLQDGKIHVGIGKHLTDFPEGTILLGNCTSKMKGKGVFIRGCPPVSSEALRLLGEMSLGRIPKPSVTKRGRPR